MAGIRRGGPSNLHSGQGRYGFMTELDEENMRRKVQRKNTPMSPYGYLSARKHGPNNYKAPGTMDNTLQGGFGR